LLGRSAERPFSSSEKMQSNFPCIRVEFCQPLNCILRVSRAIMPAKLRSVLPCVVFFTCLKAVPNSYKDTQSDIV